MEQELDLTVELGLQAGTVTQYDHRNGSGVIESPQGEITFHKSNRVEPQLVDQDIAFKKPSDKINIQPGIKVLARAVPGIEGLVARQWCLLGDFNAVRKTYKKLPLYRITERVTVNGTPVADPVTRSWVSKPEVSETQIWTGRRMSRLAIFLQEYRRPAHANYVDLIFEVLNGDNWVRCTNPLLQRKTA